MASISKREWVDNHGVTQVRWDLTYSVDGQRKYETCYSKREAEDRAAEVRTDKRRGTYLDPAKGRVKFRAYAEQWLHSKNFPAGTRMQVETRLRAHVYPVLGDLQLAQVKPTTIRSWMNRLKGAESSKSVVYIHVNDILSCAVDDELIGTNPCRRDSVQRHRPRQPIRVVEEVWSPEQVNDLWDALPDRYDVMVPLGARLGLRAGEMLGLSPGDVDFLRGVVHVRRQVKRLPNGQRVLDLPKYGKERDVPLFEGARDALAAYLAQFPAQDVTLPWADPDEGTPTTVPLIVTTARGMAVDSSRFNTEVWRPALKRAGVTWESRKTGLHQLRHYCASTWLALGYSEVEVAKFLGHTDPAFTLRVYTHFIQRPDDDTRRRAVEEFNARRSPRTADQARMNRGSGAPFGRKKVL